MVQRRQFMTVLVVRAVVFCALLGSTIFFNIRQGDPGLSGTQAILYVLAAIVLLVTVGYLLWLKRGLRLLGLHLQIQVVFDSLVATLLVYITGGVESPFTVFYGLPIIQTTVFYPRRVALWTAGLCCLMLAALFILEHQGILPLDLDGRLFQIPSSNKVMYLLAFNFAVFLLIAWLAGTLAEKLRRTDQELRLTEEQVKSLAALNRDIVQSLRSGLLALDMEGRVSLVNPVAVQILGCDAKQALGKAGREVFPSLREVSMSEGSGIGRLDVDHKLPDGRLVPIGLVLSRLTRTGGEPVGTLVHMQDLTEKRAMEASMKKAERMAALGSMAAVIAHEIRNPLAAISGSVQMLKRSQRADDADLRLMDIVLRETHRLASLVSEFLGYARPREPKKKRVDLSILIEETVEAFSQCDRRKQTPIQMDLASVEVDVDSGQFRQVLWNLLNNADQACDGQGQIRIDLRAEAADVLIEVQDDGPGIEAELRGRVFEPFFTTREQGTGLGLAVVAQIVEAHHGNINLICPESGGSRFIIRIKATDQTTDEQDICHE
jgi:two-component system sensor histidine kinase PilS (NtrC family)